MPASALTIVHELAAVLAVGGLTFAWLFLAPALRTGDAETRLMVWHQSLRMFLRGAAVALVLLWATGAWLMFVIFGGFGKAGHIDGMFTLAIVWTVLYFWINHGPFAGFRRAVAARDFSTAETVLPKVRRLLAAAAIVGLLTVAIAASGL